MKYNLSFRVMVDLFPLNKQKAYPIFGRFNASYSKDLTEFCHRLKEFQIDILTYDEFEKDPGILPLISLKEEDAFACSSDLQEDDISATKAGIIFNQACIDALGLTEEEQYAAIAHEIGHIIYRFSSLKEQYPGPLGQEVYADSIACEIGLAPQMLSMLEKMECCGLFSDAESRFGMRKLIIQSCLSTETIRLDL